MAIQFYNNKILFASSGKIAMDPACCCEEEWEVGDPCGSCDGDTPANFLVTIQGVTNDTCDACDALNGEFLCVQASNCSWSYGLEDEVCVNGCRGGKVLRVFRGMDTYGQRGLHVAWESGRCTDIEATRWIMKWFLELSNDEPCAVTDEIELEAAYSCGGGTCTVEPA